MKKKKQREGIECADGGTVVVKLCENSVMCLTRQVSPLLLSSSAHACLFHFLLISSLQSFSSLLPNLSLLPSLTPVLPPV